MSLRTLAHTTLKDKRVLMRVDFNVPLNEETGVIEDDTRIRAVLPTLKELLARGVSRAVLMSHLGRPKGVEAKLSTVVVAERLSELLGEGVQHVDSCTDVDFSKYPEKRIFMLENTRFYKEEKECDKGFAGRLAEYGDVFVNDAFGVSHRAECSVTTVAEVMKGQGKEVAAGLLLEREVEMLSRIAKNPKAPFVMIVSGAKIDTKIGMIEHFYDQVDTFILGGGIANTFLAATGNNVASSLYEVDQVEHAREIMAACEEHVSEVVLPTDVVVASEISDSAQTLDIPVEDVEGDMRILDLGKNTLAKCEEIIRNAETIVWNGPVGVYEHAPFAQGTQRIARAIAQNKNATTVVGGGDTVDALNRFGISFDEYTHVSTGGGAMIEFLEGKGLPGIDVLVD